MSGKQKNGNSDKEATAIVGIEDPQPCGLLLDDGKSRCGKPATVVMKSRESSDDGKKVTETPICSECAQDRDGEYWVLTKVWEIYQGKVKVALRSVYKQPSTCDGCHNNPARTLFHTMLSNGTIELKLLCKVCEGGLQTTVYQTDEQGMVQSVQR